MMDECSAYSDAMREVIWLKGHIIFFAFSSTAKRSDSYLYRINSSQKFITQDCYSF